MDPPQAPGAPGVRVCGVASIPDSLLLKILGRVSWASWGFSQALVCRRWAALAPPSQQACSCRPLTRSRSDAELLRLSQELSRFPRCAALGVRIEGPALESLAPLLPRTVQHLLFLEDDHEGGARELQVPSGALECLQVSSPGNPRTLPALRSLICLRGEAYPEVWSHYSLLRVLDLGGMRQEGDRPRNVFRERKCRPDCTRLAAEELPLIPSLARLRVLRVAVDCSVTALPESWASLGELQELSLSANGLSLLPAEVGRMRSLRKILLHTWNCGRLPESITQLSQLSFLYLSADFGVQGPPGMSALTGLKAIEMNLRWDMSLQKAESLFQVPSLSRLSSVTLPLHMAALTNLRELTLRWNPHNHWPDDLWGLCSLTALELMDLHRVPDAMSGLAGLRHLQISHCEGLKELPSTLGELSSLTLLELSSMDSLASLPETLSQLANLEELVVKDCKQLCSLPGTVGSWPGLRCLRLSGLPWLDFPDALREQLQGLETLNLKNIGNEKGKRDKLGIEEGKREKAGTEKGKGKKKGKTKGYRRKR